MNAQPQVTKTALPSHVDPSRLVHFDMFNIEAVDEEYQKSIARFHEPGIPDIFYTPENGGHWVFTRDEDIHYAFTHPELFSSTLFFVPKEKNPDPPLYPMMSDAPDHPRLRALLAPAFTPRMIMSLTDKARSLAIQLIEGFKPTGGCEFMKEFAYVLPIAVFLGMVDLPESDRPMLQALSDQHVRPANPQEHIDSMTNLIAYAKDKLKERRANPGDDLISFLIKARLDGKPLDEHMMAGMVVLLLLAGLDTVASLMGFFARFLALSPPHRHQLIARPDLTGDAVEELIRRFGVANPGRVVMKDFDYKGVQFRAGDMLILVTVFTGLDDRKYENPLEVNFERPVITHAAFGLGPHRCLGSTLARAELRIFLEEWLPRIPEFAIKPGEHLQISTGTVAGIHRLPLVWPAV